MSLNGNLGCLVTVKKTNNNIDNALCFFTRVSIQSILIGVVSWLLLCMAHRYAPIVKTDSI